MKILTYVAFVVLLVGVYFSLRTPNNPYGDDSSVLSKETQSDLYDNTSKVEEQEIEGNQKDKGLISPTPVLTKTPNQIKISDDQDKLIDINDYIYQGAVVIKSSLSELEMSISADPGTVTEWYKDKFTSKGLSVRTFVTTKTNGNIYSEMVGTLESETVRVVIKKNTDSPQVSIIVTLTNG
jgi:hypothetical protein